MTFEQLVIKGVFTSLVPKWEGQYVFYPPEGGKKVYDQILRNIRSYHGYSLYGLTISYFWYNTQTDELSVQPYAKGQDLLLYQINPETLDVWQNKLR